MVNLSTYVCVGDSAVGNNASSTPVATRVLKDIFHLMNMIDIPKDHGLKKEFSRRLRDALFVPDRDDRARVEAFLATQGTTWEEKFEVDPAWILRRTKRTVPPPDVLLP